MNVNATPFLSLHKDLVEKIQRLLGEYTKDLHRQHSQSAQLRSAQTPDDRQTCDWSEFPILPEIPLTGSMKKRDLVDVMRTYLHKHYRMQHCHHHDQQNNNQSHVGLASGRAAAATPYNTIAKDTPAFIPASYLPKGFKFRDPHNMRKDEILEFWNHIQKRQVDIGITDAFRFSHYSKGNDRCPAIYSNADALESPAEGTSSAPTGKTARGKQHGRHIQHTSTSAPSHQPAPSSPRRTDLHEPTAPPVTDVIPAVVPGISTTGTMIDQSQKNTLLSIGIDVGPPINGPNDGPPQYMIPAIAQMHLQPPTSTPPTNDNPLSPIVDPALLNLDSTGLIWHPSMC